MNSETERGKGGAKLIEAAKEAVAVTRGEKKPARVTHYCPVCRGPTIVTRSGDGLICPNYECNNGYVMPYFPESQS